MLKILSLYAIILSASLMISMTRGLPQHLQSRGFLGGEKRLMKSVPASIWLRVNDDDQQNDKQLVKWIVDKHPDWMFKKVENAEKKWKYIQGKDYELDLDERSRDNQVVVLFDPINKVFYKLTEKELFSSLFENSFVDKALFTGHWETDQESQRQEKESKPEGTKWVAESNSKYWYFVKLADNKWLYKQGSVLEITLEEVSQNGDEVVLRHKESNEYYKLTPTELLAGHSEDNITDFLFKGHWETMSQEKNWKKDEKKKKTNSDSNHECKKWVADSDPNMYFKKIKKDKWLYKEGKTFKLKLKEISQNGQEVVLWNKKYGIYFRLTESEVFGGLSQDDINESIVKGHWETTEKN